jgi:hypothetical protein
MGRPRRRLDLTPVQVPPFPRQHEKSREWASEIWIMPPSSAALATLHLRVTVP